MAEKKKHRKRSFIISFCIVALCAYFAISLVSSIKTISDKKNEIATVVQQKEAQDKANKELEKAISSGDIDEYAEKVARDKLGYVKPGERVYYDTSVTD